ncbi:MAG: 3-phosphoshikimate 1-carboxyvinyltransferase [Ruminococcus sp.]|nr:3-phosphoshikimate 1-carboxyvinyltransferase [Ruminococcus sp.]
MDIRIQPCKLSGDVSIPSSKSYAHRALICAALASGRSVIDGISMSKDIEATISAMSALGADCTVGENGRIIVDGITAPSEKAIIDCNESGSTLRFVIPIAAALGADAEFRGRGRLPERPIDIYTRELSKNGIKFEYNNTMPFEISGQLSSGVYEIEGNVSSQFITGLLFALPLLKGDSVIKLTSKLESKPYVDITIDCLKRFGIEIEESDESYIVKGSQKYIPCDVTVEGDYSQAAFFYTANALGSSINLKNLNPESVQGDKKILDIISEMCYNGTVLKKFNADCSDIPDLVPILTVLGCFGTETSEIFNAERLKIKESDRLEAISVTLNKLGGNVTVTEDGLIIEPVSSLHGGIVDSFGDHRIVMSAAIAATMADGDIIIKNAQAVEKSYPDFFRDYNNLGGKANVITLE